MEGKRETVEKRGQLLAGHAIQTLNTHLPHGTGVTHTPLTHHHITAAAECVSVRSREEGADLSLGECLRQ